MSDIQQPASPMTSSGPLHRSEYQHRRVRPALAAGAAVALVVTIVGVVHAHDPEVTSLVSTAGSGTGGSTSYLTTNSATVAGSVTGALVDIVSTESYQNAKAAGTGMILSSSGEILTNNHVIEGATSIQVTVVSTGRSYAATVVGTDPTEDIAVLQLSGASGLKSIPIGDSRTVKVGQQVVARGNAGGAGGAPSVVTGTVTALDQPITASDQGLNPEQLTGLIETNAPIVAGDSGGALATTAGKVIGINTAASATTALGTNQSSADSQAYAIPIRTALTIAHEIETGQVSSTVHVGAHGFLGVELQQQGDYSGGGFYGPGGFSGAGGSYGGFGGDTSTASGAVIGGVITSGAAANAGLEAGDVITSIGGQTVDSVTTLNTLMANTKAGQKVSLGWTDTFGQTHTATVTLGTAAAD